MFLVSFDKPEVATPYGACLFAFEVSFFLGSLSTGTKGKIFLLLFLQKNKQ
jgi:hypothetical protein